MKFASIRDEANQLVQSRQEDRSAILPLTTCTNGTSERRVRVAKHAGPRTALMRPPGASHNSSNLRASAVWTGPLLIRLIVGLSAPIEL